MARTALPTIKASLVRAIARLDMLQDGAPENTSYRGINDLMSEIEFAEACTRQLEIRKGKIVGVNPNNGEIT